VAENTYCDACLSLLLYPVLFDMSLVTSGLSCTASFLQACVSVGIDSVSCG
jgi:hypothetical protein